MSETTNKVDPKPPSPIDHIANIARLLVAYVTYLGADNFSVKAGDYQVYVRKEKEQQP